MSRLKFFLTFLILNSTFLIGEASAQWWTQGGNLLWPYGDVTVQKNLNVGMNLTINDTLWIDTLYFSRFTFVEDEELANNDLFLNLSAALDNSSFVRYQFGIGGFWIKKDNNNIAALTPDGANLGIISGNHINLFYGYNTPRIDLHTSDAIKVSIMIGTGSPEGVKSSGVGSLYLRLDGGAGTTLYVKQSGTGTTGWVGK